MPPREGHKPGPVSVAAGADISPENVRRTQSAAVAAGRSRGRESQSGDRQNQGESLAEMVGTTRSRVSFFMNKFRKLGFVAYNRGALSVYSSLLTVLLQD